MSFYRFDNKRVLVTGGTGTIGSEVVKQLLTEGARVIIYSRDQNKQFAMDHVLCSKRITYRNGDVCDFDLLTRIFNETRPDYVVHCAASKHVPLCEENPDSAIKINVEGTRNVLRCAFNSNASRFLLLSTDKAVYPTSTMGFTKALAEKLALEFNRVIPVSVVRLGNVFGSNGSVVPTLFDRIKNKLPLLLNDPDAVRYFLTKRQSGEFILQSLDKMQGGEIFIPKMKLMRINDLIEAIRPDPAYPVSVRTLGSGEKLDEELMTSFEERCLNNFDDRYVIQQSPVDKDRQDFDIKFFTVTEIQDLLKGLKHET